jgi:outer membrane protein OmpA-like peptidoglycan-associated protein
VIVLRALVVLAVVMATAGCAATPKVATPAVVTPRPPTRDETVVLLPGRDGRAGALTVTHEGQERVLDAAYAASRLQGEGKLEDGGRLTAEQVQQMFGDALGAQPPRPITFILYFLDASDDFTPESKQKLARVLQEIGGHPAPEIVVVGHTDRVGSVAYNDALSLRRAGRVRDQLVQIGIPGEQILVAGRGEREPRVPTEDEVAEPLNRRVEITVR